ncbi:HlyD family efflux transporter periplasmic adaptor subunit [Olivibacter sp. SDN3]|uniref:efflux RND transporter periplasmic adaptor subunit n=1 Tax=Olivibacter sp. SDN3 TaxID=2764720 RepID=UPI001650DA97|nr:HlyD family efflux transporter periplasmic adaptor subunit [Olivibacter sp. SDN3]QNL50918.1 HlyD family efflux transporter periplasmic adaptor subunit [Olivibacter sp. SDN3]
MDRALPKKRWTNKRIATLVGVVGIGALIFSSYYFTSGNSRLNVDAERITLSEVSEGPFREFIPVNGMVMPISTIYLDASEGGRVEERFVEDGAVLKKGDPIMRLSNTDLELSLVNQETQVLNLLTQAQISETQAQQASISNKNSLATANNGLVEAKRVYELNKHLYEQKAIGKQEYQEALNEYNYQKEMYELTKQNVMQDSIINRRNMEQSKRTYGSTNTSLELMRRKVDDLIVRAPVDGQLTALDAEIGQSKVPGDRFGQIDVLSGFKVRADIDEHYISRIYPDLDGEVVLSGKAYKLKIRKVYTQVLNGRFQVDMEFEGDVPKGIRRGQTLQIRLALSDETKAVLLPKGGFYQQTGGNWVFKLSADGKTAYRADVQLGRQNPDYYEVIQGLEPGEKVVTSSYETYDKVQELNIK